MNETFYFIVHPCGDKSKVTVIDLSHAASYERCEWDCINEEDFDNHQEAIKSARNFALTNNLEYELFDSRYDSNLNE